MKIYKTVKRIETIPQNSWMIEHLQNKRSMLLISLLQNWQFSFDILHILRTYLLLKIFVKF